MSVTKAVIPAAGHGARMAPVTRTIPKELLPIGSKPAIHWVVEEAVRAGLMEIAVILSPSKALVFEYLSESRELAELGVRFEYVEQTVQRGLADAMWQCRDFCNGEPFGLLLPDNVLLSPQHNFSEMVRLHEESGRDVIGVLELNASHSGQYGNCGLIEFDRTSATTVSIRKLHGKGEGRLQIEPGSTLVRTCGRYLCRSHVFRYMEPLRARALGSGDNGAAELDEVPVYQEIILREGAVGSILPMPLFDIGHPAGFAAANGYWGSKLQEAGPW